MDLDAIRTEEEKRRGLKAM